MVRGSALHRCSNLRFHDDETLRREWMAGRRNPATGEALEIWAGALPPGSMVSIPCHALHGVSSRKRRGDERDGYLHTDSTRWCQLFTYRQPDPEMVIPPTGRGIPEPFRLALGKGEVEALRGDEGARRLFEPY